MDNNPVSGPAPTPAPEPTPTPTSAPVPEPTSVAEPTLELAQEPAPEPAPVAEPIPAPVPEPTSVAEPTPEPAPAPTPTAEPTSAPVTPSVDAPVDDTAAPVNPFSPNNPADPAPVAGNTPVQDGKKLSGKLIGIIAGVGVLLLGLIIVFILHFTSSTPEKIFSSAMTNLLDQKVVALDATAEAISDDGSYKYSISAYADGGDTAYVRISGLGDIFKALFSVLGAKIDEDALDKIKEIDGKWWKIDAKSEASTSILSGFANVDFSNYDKVASAYKSHPFLKATKITGDYTTSGTAYKVSVDKDKYHAFEKSLEDSNIDSVSLGVFEIDEDTEDFVVTIASSFFGGGTMTGLYLENNNGSYALKTSIDFEHATKTVPTDAKDISEIEKMLTEIMMNSESSYDDSYDDSYEGISYDSNADRDRRNDYSVLSASMTNYMVNNNGQLPPVGKLDATKYINATGMDSEGNPYDLELVDYAADYEITTSTFLDKIPVYVVWHAHCEGDELVDVESNRAFAIYGSLDSGVYCSSSN